MRIHSRTIWIMALLLAPAFAALTLAQGAFDEKAFLLHMQNAQANEDKANFAGAAADYEALARIDPSNSVVHWAGACRNRAAAGEIAQALKDCDAALAAVPDFPPAHDARGLVYLKTGEFDKALAEFDAALRVFPNVPFSYYGRGLAKLKLGDGVGGNADIAKANLSQPDIANKFARYGVAADSRMIAGPPACSDASAGSGAQNLAAIPKCAVVYCAPGADPQARKNLKHIDDMLVELQLRIANLKASVQKFQRACRALAGDLRRSGPGMDNFRTASYEFGISKGRLQDISESLQKPPEENIFVSTSTNMARVFKQPACMTQINQQTTDALNAAQSVLDNSDLDCSPEAIRSWR